MKYSLDLTLYHKQPSEIQAVIDQLPTLTDTTVWQEQYEVSPISLADELSGLPAGTYMASAMVRFHNNTDREAVYQAIINIQGVLQGFEVGTKIQKHTCGHDDGLPCEVEIAYEVVA